MTTPQTHVKPAPSAPQANVKPATPVVPAQTDTKPQDNAKPQADAKPDKPEITLEDIAGGFILTAELSSVSAPVRARSDKQKAMDSKVKELHAKWIAAGKPSTWDAMVKGATVATYFVEPDKSADLHKLITRAVAFHGLRARMGTSFKVTETLVKRHNLPLNYLGREAISFAVLDKRPRGTSDDKPASEIVKK